MKIISIVTKLILIATTIFLIADVVRLSISKKTYSTPQEVVESIKELKDRTDKLKVIPTQSSYTPDISPQKQDTSLQNLRLIGTVIGENRKDSKECFFAVIEDTTQKKQNLYRINDSVRDGWKITKILKNKVYIVSGLRKEVLETRFIEEVSPAVKSDTGRYTTNRYILDYRDVQSALADLNIVMTHARVIPEISEGKTHGYKIFEIIPNSIYSKVGLINGDIIQRINGVELKSPETIYHLFDQLKNQREITIDLLRRGDKMSILAEIR
ncbi:MAG: type II secretion system protein N [Nitrospirota bacterium]